VTDMPDITPGGIARYDVHDPADLAQLVASGLIWRSGPKTLRLALDAIVDGRIARPTHNVPPAVDAWLDRKGVVRTI
jgi:hypothetical protein